MEFRAECKPGFRVSTKEVFRVSGFGFSLAQDSGLRVYNLGVGV